MQRSLLRLLVFALIATSAGLVPAGAAVDDEQTSFIVGWGGDVGSGASTYDPQDQVVPSGQWTPLIWGNRIIDDFHTDRGLDDVFTTVAASSAGARIGNVDVIHVANTRGFPDPEGKSGGDTFEWAMWQDGNGDLHVFRYRGTTSTSLTGVSLGSTTTALATGDRIAPAPVSLYGVPANHSGFLQQGLVNVLWQRDPDASGVRLLRQTVYDGVLDAVWFHSDELAGRDTETQWQHFSFQPGQRPGSRNRQVVEVYQTSGSDLRVQGVPAQSPLLALTGFSDPVVDPPTVLTFPFWTRPPWLRGSSAGFVDVTVPRQLDAVDWASANGVTTGLSVSRFGPELSLTRGQAATMLWRMAGRPTAARGHPFVDVTAAWQRDAVSWMADVGVTTGTSPSTFTPDGPLTRGQAAALIHRFVGSPTPARSHPFADISAPWQDDPVSWMAGVGVTTGTAPTTFSPDRPMTRGDFAVLLHRLARHFQPGL